MKKIAFLTLQFIFFSCHLFSQTSLTTKFRLQVLMPGIGFEQELAPGLTLSAKGSLKPALLNYQTETDFGTATYFFPYLEIEPRFYPAFANVSGNETDGFSGFYVGLEGRYGISLNENILPWYTYGAVAGYQKTFAKILYVNLSGGAGFLKRDIYTYKTALVDIGLGVVL